jgi:GxxExxY protein
MINERLLEPEATSHVIGAFFDVYNHLGFGFFEHIYAEALHRELQKRERAVQRECIVEIWYRGDRLARQRVDMIVDNKVLVEIKSTPVLPSTAQRQLLNYLRATTLQVGLLLHFGPEPRFYRKIHSDKSALQNPVMIR